MAYSTIPLMGMDLDRVDATAAFPIGTATIGSDGHFYTYVVAGGAIAASQTDITVSTAFSATDGAGTNVGPSTAVSSGEYFWVHNANLVVDTA